MKTIYIQVNEQNIITDMITYPYGDYVEVIVSSIPTGIMGGWFKYENGQVVEYPALKPVDMVIDNSRELQTLKASQMQIEQLFKTKTQLYTELDSNSVNVADMQKAKMAQLDEACNLAIVNGFTHTINTEEYLFSCSLAAQANFQGTDALFKEGLILEAEWTAVNTRTGEVERVMLTKPVFNAIKIKLFQHINMCISKFRNTLQPLVMNAKTNADIHAVKW